jgi:hypothetical protein
MINGIRQSQGHGRDYAGNPNIGQTRLNSVIEDLDRSTQTVGIIKD